MANRLAKIYGTEEDKVNCPFYFKIGSCRHGDKCVRIHNKPLASQTILLRHMYQNPPVAIAIAEGQKVSDESLKEAIRHFEDFYEEIFIELSKCGEIEDVVVCDNLGDHLIGNVFVKFSTEDYAANALKTLNGRYYAGKQIVGEFSPVTDFKESRCRQYDEGSCGRGGFCNFMHLKYISKNFKNSLFEQMYDEHPEYKKTKKKEKEKPEVKKPRKRSFSRDSKDSGDCNILFILVGDKTSPERRKVIERWNRQFDKDREEERRKKEAAEAKINFILLQQKIQDELNRKKGGLNDQ